MVKAYGLDFPAGTTPATIELKCFHEPWMREHSGLSRYQHCRNAIDLLWNIPRQQYAKARGQEYDLRKHDAFIWNDWTDLMISEMCMTPWRTITGPNSSWKTTSAAIYHLCCWFSSPHDTLIIVTSTSLDGLRARIWKEIVKYYKLAGAPCGNLVQSEISLQFVKGSLEAGIFGVATGQDGDVEKAVGKILGRHNTNTFGVVDEMQATNPALVKGATSLRAGSDKFEFTGLGNAQSELDPHGEMSEPIGGWDSITVDSERWETKRGVCIHLDGLRSPRVIEGDEFYPGLLTKGDIEETIKHDGEDSPEFWSKRRGFWAPQGVTRTVLSTTMITKFKAREKAIWVSGFQMGAGLDPAFEGGDRCMLRFGKCGEFAGTAPSFDEPNTFRGLREQAKGTVGIEIGEKVQIKVSATSDEPIHYQIVRQVKDECEKRGVGPEMFALDSTGEGGGLASIFQREWSPAITLVEFGGRASELPVSEHNKKPSSMEYLYMVTELWYGFRVLVQNGQIRGLDNDAAIEFCQRLYMMVGNLKKVETKTEMKKRTRKSPDDADAIVVLCELFRRKLHMSLGAAASPHSIDRSWEKFVKANDTSDEQSYLVEV
jgi:hypothetical protein